MERAIEANSAKPPERAPTDDRTTILERAMTCGSTTHNERAIEQERHIPKERAPADDSNTPSERATCVDRTIHGERSYTLRNFLRDNFDWDIYEWKPEDIRF